MLHLERAPHRSKEYIAHISAASTGIELPSGLLLPEQYQDHPALSLPYEVASRVDEVLSPLGGAPVWGGMVSDEFHGSILYLNDAIPGDLRPHLGALYALTTYGEHPRIVRSILSEARRVDKNLEEELGSTLLYLARLLEPMYCGVSAQEERRFLEQTGSTIESHRQMVRAEGGEVVFMSEQRQNLLSKTKRKGYIESAWLQSEVPLGYREEDKTQAIGNPFAYEATDRILSARLTQEPANPRKPHTCAGCHLHIAPKALRVTIEVDSSSQFDHHHFHASCV